MNFNDVKKGDEVFITGKDGGYFKVERVNPASFKANGITFSKRNGRESHNDYSTRYAEDASPEAKKKREYMEAVAFVHRFTDLNMYDLPTEECTKIIVQAAQLLRDSAMK